MKMLEDIQETLTSPEEEEEKFIFHNRIQINKKKLRHMIEMTENIDELDEKKND